MAFPRSALFGLLLGTACAPGERYLARAWSDDEAAVLLIAQEDGSFQSELLVDGRAFEADVDRAEQVYVLVYSKIPELDFEVCGIELGDAHPLGREPARVLTADLQSDAAVLAPIEDHTQWPRPSLSYQRCDPDLFDCRNWHGATSLGPIGFPEARDMTILDAGAIFYIVREDASAEAIYRLVRFDGTSHHFVEFSTTHGALYGLAADGDRVWATTALTRVAFDRLGRELQTETSTPGLNRVAAGPGARIAYGPGGLLALEGDVLPRQDRIAGAAVISESKILVVTKTSIEAWDGARWTLILDRRPGDQWEGVAGDDESELAVEFSGAVLHRGPLSSGWQTRESLFGIATRLQDGAPLGGGRFAVSGQLGMLGLFDGQPCVVDPQEHALRSFVRVQRTPDGRQLVVLASGIGDSQGDAPALVIYPIPDQR